MGGKGSDTRPGIERDLELYEVGPVLRVKDLIFPILMMHLLPDLLYYINYIYVGGSSVINS